LDGPYCDDRDSRLISPPFVVPGAALSPALRFWHWFSFSTSDYGEVQIKVGDEPWEVISQQYSGTSSGVWSPVYIPLAAYADMNVRIAFDFHSDDPYTDSGWYVDSLEVDNYNVPTRLRTYQTVAGDTWIEIRWDLNEAGTDARYRVLRECVSDGALTEFALRNDSRDDLSFHFRDDGVRPGSEYRYTVMVADEGGSRILFVTEPITVPEMTTELLQNFPNPFNPSTTISYTTAQTAHVSLRVYSTSGTLIKTLYQGTRTRGTYEAVWDGRNERGERVASGVYFYRLLAGKVTHTRKMVMLK
jgi:hypothetical protein